MNRIKYNALLNEKIYFKRLSNAMKCYIIPRSGYVEKQAILGVNYGSVDNVFRAGGRKHVMPAGVAHFLEHKLFEDEEINVFERFTDLGASVNAFTNFTSTAYYFNCGENFHESLQLLLSFTQRPYFTAENVEKEKPIIAQEIEMYEDNPFWIMYRGLLHALYETSPVRENIAGSVEGIRAVDPKLLYRCYHTFYKPENMTLVCVGAIEPEAVIETAERYTQKAADLKPFDVQRVYGKEPTSAVKKYAEETMPLARPMFQIGFKDSDFSGDYAIRVAATKILLDMIAGESSEFFETLYTEGLVDGPIISEYVSGTFYGMAVCAGSGDRPREVASRFLGELNRLRASGLDEQRFQQIKRKHLGRFVRGFNALENIAHGQMELAFRSADLFDLLHAYRSVTFAQAAKRFSRIFRDDNYAVSVISPAG